MSTVSVSLSASLLPSNLPQDVNYRPSCVSSASPSTVRSHLSLPRRRRFSYPSRKIPGFSGFATDDISVQSPAVPTSVPVRVAHELLQAGHHFLDVRTPEEFSDGHVVGAVNVPFMLRLGPGMARNPKFVEEVFTHFHKDDEVIVGCQLGKRSLMAASELLSFGFTGVADMAGGYAAWIQNGLPVE